MSSLETRVEPIEGVTNAVTVHLDGVLDQPTLTTFQNQLADVRKDGNLLVVLNMEGVSYANSTALGSLVTQADTFREAGGELIILKPQPKVDLVIDMLGLASLFKVFATEQDARDYIGAVDGPAPPAPSTAAAPPANAPAAPAATAAFPLQRECVGCGTVLEFSQAGHFRCPRCYTVYSAEPNGRLTGSKPRAGQPIEVSLTCQPRSMKAFQHFVGALPAWEGYTDTERARLEAAIGEVCQAIHQTAYEGDPAGSFHCLIVSRDDGLALRLADHGKPLDPSAFPIATEYMTELEHRPHPTRGNVLKMTKRVT